jgi:hypothetical protein
VTEHVAHDRTAERHPGAGADRLERARHQQHLDAIGEGREHASQREQGRAGDQQASPPEMIRERPHQQHASAVCDQVHGHGVLHSRRGHLQRAGDRRQRRRVDRGGGETEGVGGDENRQ